MLLVPWFHLPLYLEDRHLERSLLIVLYWGDDQLQIRLEGWKLGVWESVWSCDDSTCSAASSIFSVLSTEGCSMELNLRQNCLTISSCRKKAYKIFLPMLHRRRRHLCKWPPCHSADSSRARCQPVEAAAAALLPSSPCKPDNRPSTRRAVPQRIGLTVGAILF